MKNTGTHEDKGISVEESHTMTEETSARIAYKEKGIMLNGITCKNHVEISEL